MSLTLIILITILIPSIIFHEIAHGLAADKLGDPTARLSGRLSLNPLSHLDPIGSLLLPGIIILSNSPFIIGWAKPVPVNPYNLNNPKKDMIWVSLAGPATNLALAVIFALPLRLGILDGGTLLGQIFLLGLRLNILLAIFNLIPVPPLDGSRILSGLLPADLSLQFNKIEPFGIFIILILFLSGVMWQVILPITETLASILLGKSLMGMSVF
jgi:Zn-dependent protease